MKLMFLAVLSIAPGLAAECPSSEMSPAQTQARFQELDRKAQVEFRHGEFAKAAEDFQQATCAAPDNVRPYYALYGTAAGAVATGDFSSARQALQQADRLRPDYPLPLAMLVKVNLISSDIDNLKKCLLNAAQRFPRDSKLHAELAQDLLHEKQYDLALAEALRAADSGAAGGRAGINLAVLENQVGAFGDAARLAAAIEEQAELPEKVRASGAAIAGLSYESSGQLQEAMRHFKEVAERLLELFKARGFDTLLVGCHDESWPEFEPHLHAYLKQRLAGRFSADPTTPATEFGEHIQRLLAERKASERQALIREVIGEAHRNGRGVVGLRQVLLSLEKGEVQTLLLGSNFAARAVECRHCGHMDTRTMKNCTLCGQETTEIEDIADSLVADAMRRGADIVQVDGDLNFDAAGNVGALLRFRSDQNTAEKMAS